MAIAKEILDAQARLDTAIAAVSAKVDTLIAGGTSAMTPEDVAAVAAGITASAVAVEAVNAK